MAGAVCGLPQGYGASLWQPAGRESGEWRPQLYSLSPVLLLLPQLAKPNWKPEGKATNSSVLWGIEQDRDNGEKIWNIHRKYLAQNLRVLFYTERYLERWALSSTEKSQGWKLTVHFIKLTWNDHTHTNSTGQHIAMKISYKINAETQKNVMKHLSEHDTVYTSNTTMWTY